MPNVDNPHFAVPFRFTNQGPADVVEQGSPADVSQQIEAVIRTIKGERLDLQDFGIDDQVFVEGSLSLTPVLRDIERYVPGSQVFLGQESDQFDPQLFRMLISILNGEES
jgi:hypothetical protein